MGAEITREQFRRRDARRFLRLLREETALLGHWFERASLADEGQKGGFELEAFLVDGTGRPAPVNSEYLDQLHESRVVPELARFNIELNGRPQALRGAALSRMAEDLRGLLGWCETLARRMKARLCTIGILPTVAPEHLTLDDMSPLKRYRALNTRLLRRQPGRRLKVAIKGREELRHTHDSIMLEAATTSFQIHVKVSQREAVRFYNASTIVAAPMVAVAANSPYLFGRDLWAETRIPLFEQIVATGRPVQRSRATFGRGYVMKSLFECFLDNLRSHPPLLPLIQESPPDALSHLRLHNGTIWRWNRPLIGFDDDDRPHLRIEHRIVPSGPTAADCIANAGFFLGLIHALARQEIPPETRLPFDQARANFYKSAYLGLEADLHWIDGKQRKASNLLLHELIPRAKTGLCQLGLAEQDIARYTGIIAARVQSGQNGSSWQRAYVRRHGRDMRQLTAAYLEHQATGAPVHEWSV